MVELKAALEPIRLHGGTDFITQKHINTIRKTQ